ncbi:MAG: type II toxin-antitoxin system VapC family toxin [Bacillota bacterium]|nr:type II toxin-antitoxin system VapC family toxin [Bacillota bacterium]
MTRAVIDTSIIIDHLKGIPAATAYLKGLEEGTLGGIVSSVTYTELFAGERMTDRERRQIEMLLALMETADVTPNIAREAGILLSLYRRSHGLTPLDAIIAATSLNLVLPLATRNVKDFQFIPDLKVISPY